MVRAFCALILISCISTNHLQQNPIPVKGYKLVWNDEFDGERLDKTKWSYRGLGKRDEAYIQERAVKLDGNGNLVMKVSMSMDSVITGMIGTEHLFETTYGYFECRAKFANIKGTFPAFWLQSRSIAEKNSTPSKAGAEIDIFEFFPHMSSEQVYHTLHWGGYGAGHRVEGPVTGRLSKTPDDFHIIGFEWTDSSYTTFVDGKQTFTGTQFISHVPEYIVLSLGVNQQTAGPLNPKDLPAEFLVDYVRVYKKKN